MRFRVSIDCRNAAFADDGPGEVARILRDLAKRIEGHGVFCDVLRLYDLNGNHVGEATTTGRNVAATGHKRKRGA